MRLHEIEQIIPVLYHGTCPENARQIIENGWKPHSGSKGSNMGQTRYLYLTTDPEDARWFANEKGCDTILMVLKVPLDFLIVDPEDGIGDTVEDEINNKHGLPGKLALTKALSKDHFRIFE